jgi:hypothetical protein
MMHRIAKDILESLPALWRAAIEDGIELENIQCCLRQCTKMINQVKKSKSRGDMNFKITITDTKNTTIYDESGVSILQTLAWMWRDLVVAASARGASTEAIESDINELELYDDVYDLIRPDGGDSYFTGLFFISTDSDMPSRLFLRG